jgi:hypothetical protein
MVLRKAGRMTEGQISVGGLSGLRYGHGIWLVAFMLGKANILDGRWRKYAK